MRSPLKAASNPTFGETLTYLFIGNLMSAVNWQV